MKSLISVNKKFMEISPKDFVELIKNTKYTKGIELCINLNETEEKYLSDLVFELNKNNLILQIHGDSSLNINEQIKFIKKLEEYSNILGYPIIVTLHSIYNANKTISKNKTIEYMSKLLNEIDTTKITIALENLNDAFLLDRLSKEEIEPIILNDEKLFFTYDIGHEIADYGNTTNLNEYLVEELKNIHIHTNDGRGKDHLPIYKNDINWNKIIKSLIYLKTNNYQNNIVFEYDLYECKGETIKDKIIDYLNSIDYVSERYDEGE